MIKINHKILSESLEKRLLAVNIANSTYVQKPHSDSQTDVLITIALIIIISWMF